MVTVTHDATPEELREALGYILTEAKALSRRGPVGTRTERYADLHANVDRILLDLERKTRG